MPKLVCACGDFVHNLSNIPDDGYIIVRDKDYEELIEVENNRTILGESKPIEGSPEWDKLITADARILGLTERLYECPNCNRIIWLKNIGKLDTYILTETKNIEP